MIALARKITPEQAGAAYDILVAHAGAYADTRGREKRRFAQVVTRPAHMRSDFPFYGRGFCGRLVFVGNRSEGTPYVARYGLVSADQLEIIEKVNGLLAALFAGDADG